MEILKMMPINVGCSYAGKILHEPSFNQAILIWVTIYKIPQSRKKVIHLTN